jgi:TolB-like protein/class 3 adenylate cyclase/Tfp pilus assembly protein PilF
VVNVQDTSAEPTPDLQLEIAHILLMDVVGYSKLLVNEQIELLQELKQIVRSTECFRAAEARGELIRIPTGDGMALIFFHSPEEPAQCALEISKALQDHPSIRLRMGVHSGPVSRVTDVNEKTNIAGSGINVAQRVLDCGDAEHILLSAHVAEDLCEYRHWQPYLHDLGECEVKYGLRLHLFNLYKDDLGNPQVPEKLRPGRRRPAAGVSVRPITTPRWPKYVLTAVLLVSAVALAISFSVFYRRGSPAVTRSSSGKAADVGLPIAEKSIAVLPFENRSEDEANAYFADGIQDEILSRLSKIADLKVTSRSSTEHYKSAPENVTEIGKELGVAHIVEGSVQKSGNAVRVSVRLIKATNDSQLWADTFDRKLTDIFSVETDVAKAIADQLQAKLTGQEEQVIAAKPTDNVEAYDAYLRGLAYSLKPANTAQNALNAQKYLREAVRLDPKFALSWALLSFVEARAYRTQNLQPTAALRDEARQAADTALTLEPNLGEAILAKGFYHYACLKDYDTAVSYFEQARRFLPNSSRIPELLAYLTRRRGQWDQSEAYFNQAEQLDPRNVTLLFQHALSYKNRRLFPQALRKLDQILNIMPDDMDTNMEKAVIAQAEGDLPRAAALMAPMQPAADNTNALETQAYQAILERSYAPITSRLKELLAKPDPALGSYNGELRFWLGWTQEVVGDHVSAQQSWQQARRELESFLTEEPDNYSLLGDLALIEMSLGDKAAALAHSERAIAAVPIEKDALDGPASIEFLARVAAGLGDADRAIAALQKLIRTPYPGPLGPSAPLTPALLRLDPMFDPLRNDPRFQKLCEEKQP